MKTTLTDIKMVIIDVDGVFTDGKITLDANGIESKTFYVQDGTAITYLHRAGLKTAIISGRESRVVELRAKELCIEDVYLGIHNKLEAYEKITTKHKIKDNEICYIGDDLIDLPILRKVGFPVTVPDAPLEVKEEVTYKTTASGGYGAIREVTEKILKSQGKWDAIISRYY